MVEKCDLCKDIICNRGVKVLIAIKEYTLCEYCAKKIAMELIER